MTALFSMLLIGSSSSPFIIFLGLYTTHGFLAAAESISTVDPPPLQIMQSAKKISIRMRVSIYKM
jgi:hypothetical protein